MKLKKMKLDPVQMQFSKLTLEKYGYIKLSEWHPIETAPKDGSSILGYGNFNKMTSILWDDHPGDAGWGYSEQGLYYGRLDFKPTHWMPLPEPPRQ